MTPRPRTEDGRWRRARLMVAIASAVAIAAIGFRGWQFNRAARQQSRMVLTEAPVDRLDGGFVIKPVKKGYRLTGAPGSSHRLRNGERFVVGETEFTYHQAPKGSRLTEVMAVPLRVYAARETDQGPRGGFQRIDIGGDPAGVGSPTRDRIYVDHAAIQAQLNGDTPATFSETRGVAQLLPADGEVFRLSDRSFRVLAEVPGLTRVRGTEELELPLGEPVAFDSGDHIAGMQLDLQITVEDRWRSAPLLGDGGQVVAQQQMREPTFVVRTPVEATGPTGGRAWLAFADREGEPAAVGLSPDHPTLVYGARDRLRPAGGSVIPDSLPHEELHQGFADGVEQGAIRLQRGFLVVAAEDPFLDEAGPAMTSQLRSIADRYNRGQVPATVTTAGAVGGQDLSRPSAWTLITQTGDERPVGGAEPDDVGIVLPAPGEFDPALVAAGETVRWTLAHRTVTVVAETGVLTVMSGLPVDVELDGQLLATIRGGPAEVPVDLPAGEHVLALQARYTGRPEEYGNAVGAAVNLDERRRVDAHVGRRRFVDWTEHADGGRTWSPAHEDALGSLWFASGPPISRDVTGYLQVRFDAPDGGSGRLGLQLHGELEEAWLNGAPLPADQLPMLPGEQAWIPVSLRTGSNLVALRIRQGTALPDEPQGGIRLAFQGGTLTGLHPDTERRSMAQRPPAWKVTPALGTAPARGPLKLCVARGVPGLPVGTRWLPGAGAPDGRALLLVPGPEGATETVLDVIDDLTVRLDTDAESPFTVVNKTTAAVSLYRQVDPLRRPYQPFAGFAIYAGRAEPLVRDRDAVGAGSIQVTYRSGDPSALAGAISVVRDDGVHWLELDGGGALRVPTELPATDYLMIEVRDDAVELVAAAPGTTVFRDGERIVADQRLPLMLADGDALSCPNSGLLMTATGDPSLPVEGDALAESIRPFERSATALSAGRRRRGEDPVVALTLDPEIQLLALDELRAQVALAERIKDDAGQDYPPGPEGLRGAVVVLDVSTGDILAAASEGEDPTGAWGLAWTHPGSTFKMVTALAALSSEDPDIHRMLDGELPDELVAASSGTLRGAELSRAAPSDGRWAEVDDDPLRLRTRLDNFKHEPLPAGTDLTGAFRMSSNVYFGYLALLMHRPLREGWGEAGIADPELRDRLLPLAGVAHQLEFGEILDLVPSSLRGDPPREAPLVDSTGRPITPGDPLYAWTGRFPDGLLGDPQMAASGVGQGEVEATPLQMARVAAAIANGGTLVRPSLIASVDGRILERDTPQILELPPAATERVRDGLREVVRAGTAQTAFSDNPYRSQVFGKTGSSERPGANGGHETDSWFVGVLEAPPGSSHHSVAVACVMPSAGLGGTHAADVADRVMRHIARKNGYRVAEP